METCDWTLLFSDEAFSLLRATVCYEVGLLSSRPFFIFEAINCFPKEKTFGDPYQFIQPRDVFSLRASMDVQFIVNKYDVTRTICNVTHYDRLI